MTIVLENALIENDLRLEAHELFRLPAWLENSHRDINGFWTHLKNAADARFQVKSVSALFQRYNFYYDIISRNLNNPAPAFMWLAGAGGFKSVSYGELDVLASAKAASWKLRGLKAGQHLCLIRETGLELVVELIAGLKSGCTISVIHPRGSGYMARRVSALNPDHIAGDEAPLLFLTPWRSRILADKAAQEKGAADRDQSFYASGCAVFKSFVPSGGELTPVDIPSDAAYLGALRDGCVALGLSQGDRFAAPGFYWAEAAPLMMISGLMCGATYIHLSLKDIARHPAVAADQRMKVFGVSRELREVLLQGSVAVGDRWESWFRDPAESQDMERWYAFIKQAKLDGAYAFNLRWQPSSGGCTMFSNRRKGMAHMHVLTAPASCAEFEEPAGGNSASVMNAGALAVWLPGMPEKDRRPTADVVLQNAGQCIITGMNVAHRDGRPYPAEEVLASLEPLMKRWRSYPSLADAPRLDGGAGNKMVLLVFRGTENGEDNARLLSEIKAAVSREMGDEFEPDKIEIFHLMPKFTENGVPDHEWCKQQYLNGGLVRRKKSEFFKRTTRLRAYILNANNA